MATKKDLVEAYSFSRRRLVTAFLSGAPGGREVEPARPGRTIVGGLALGVLLVAGGAVVGFLKPKTAEDWTDPGLVISKDKGAAYVIVDPDEAVDAEDADVVLRPVANITSAQLILGPDLEPRTVPQDDIDGQTIGEDIGIANAPQTVPEPEQLLQSGWTACTADERGVAVTLAEDPPVVPAAAQTGLLVRVGSARYVVAAAEDTTAGVERAYAYALPRTVGRDNLLAGLDLPPWVEAERVPKDWLALLPAGGPLAFETFGIEGFGSPYDGPSAEELPSGAAIGDYYTVDEESYVLLDGGAARLDVFSLAVYENIDFPGGDPPRELRLDSLPTVPTQLSPFEAASWPTTTLEAEQGDLCVQLVMEVGEVPRALLGVDPAEGAGAEELDRVERTQSVDPGRGAFVLSGGWDNPAFGTPHVIDAKATAYEVEPVIAVPRLGYDVAGAPVAPQSWLDLFQQGVLLSVDAALCPPTQQKVNACASE